MAAVMLAAGMALVAAPAAAHCDEISGNTLVLNNCFLHKTVEDRVEALNAAADGTVAFILVKHRQFHPENVTIKNGGTVVWVYADRAIGGNEDHDPRSSSTCGSQQLDIQQCVPLRPLNQPQPWGDCFDVLIDQGEFMKDLGDVYALTFRVNAASGALQKSEGVASGTPVVGQPPLADPFTTCPAGSASVGGAAGLATIPYHCGIHGAPLQPVDRMRGTIIVEA
jgi:plastocyanin